MVQFKSRTAQLNGLTSLAYLGVLPSSPTNFIIRQSDPTTNDYRNVYVGDMWLNNASEYAVPPVRPNIRNLWMLVAVANASATWVHFGEGTLQTLTGNSGGPVSGDVNDNINIVGDGTTINVVGNPATNTLTISAMGTGTVSSLTGNTGGAVSPLAGNINVVGDGTTISIAGNPGTHTLTASFIGGGAFVTTLHTQDGHNVTPTAGVINLSGAHGLNTTGTVGPNTATVAINNAITLGDLSVIPVSTDALTATTGDISSNIGNFNLGISNSAGTRGYLTIETYLGGAQISVLGFPGNNVVLGGNASAPALVGGSAVANILIGAAYNSITTGQDNTIIGSGVATSFTTGSNNVIVASAHALLSLTTGSQNTALGQISSGITTGSQNVLIGVSAGNNYTGAETGNILISQGGRVGESNCTYIANIRGKTTTSADAIAVLIDSSGQLGTVSSSRKVKDNINDMSSYSESIYRLRPVTFNYKNHSAESISVGLIAEEVYQVAPQLVVHTKDGDIESVKYHDLIPMLLNEIQKLHKRIEVLERN